MKTLDYEERHRLLTEKIEGYLETYLKEVAVAVLKVEFEPLPKGIHSVKGKHMVVGKRYYVIPANPKDRT
jgi:hypothetical protein